MSYLEEEDIVDTHTILIVEFGDLSGILALEHNFIVRLVPARGCSKLGAGELGERMQEQTIDIEGAPVHKSGAGK